MYALIENSIEAHASLIQIELSTSNSFILIDIKDNGTGIYTNNNDYIFDKNFTFKKPGHFGLGLFLAKNWLDSISSKLDYLEKDSLMRISIPYNKVMNNVF